MRLLISLLFFILFSSSAFAYDTWYVRADGGNSTQCTGKFDAPYPGSGTAQPCGLKHPQWVLGAGSTAGIYSGGDTILIDGSYEIGYFSGENVGGCSAAAAYDCYIPPIKDGTAGNRTKIYGSHWNLGCDRKAELYGSGRLTGIIGMGGSDHVEFQCIELTQHSTCNEFIGGAHPNNCPTSSPYTDDNYARRGIWTDPAGGVYSTDVLFKNMHIHRLGIYGIQMSIVKDIVIQDTVIEGISEGSPIQFTIGALGTPTDNTFTIQRSKIRYNGCIQEYPITSIGADQFSLCCAQSNCGNTTDGIEINSVVDSLGTVLIEDSILSHNTHDGIDLLHGNGQGSATIRRCYIAGNQGNQVKVANDTIIEDSVIEGRCSYFHSTWSGKRCTLADGCSNNGLYCRASGDTIVSDFKKTGQYIKIYGSTILSEGNVALMVQGQDGICDGSEVVLSRNNIWVGGDQWDANNNIYKSGDDVDNYYNAGSDGNGAGSCGSGITAPVPDIDHDIWVNFKTGPTATSTLLVQDPSLTDLTVVVGANESATSSWQCANLNDCMTSSGLIPSVSSPALNLADNTIVGLTGTDVNNFTRNSNKAAGGVERTSIKMCENGVEDGGENGIDCGGAFCTTCPIGSKSKNISFSGSIKFQ